MLNKEEIKLVYSYHSDKKRKQEEFVTINTNSEDLKLSKLDEILLKGRPSLVKLSIGTFKLESDFAETLSHDTGGRYITYRNV